MDEVHKPPVWLWRGAVLAITTVLVAAAILLGALSAGWNAPRPARPPDRRFAPVTLAATASSPRRVCLLNEPEGSFTLEAVATPQRGSAFNGYGLVVGARDDSHYTVFAVGADGYLAVLSIDGEEETPLLLWHSFPHIRRDGASNRLRVSCADQACEFRVNDEIAATLGDIATEGHVGLWTRWFDGPSLQVTFNDVSRWRYQIP